MARRWWSGVVDRDADTATRRMYRAERPSVASVSFLKCGLWSN